MAVLAGAFLLVVLFSAAAALQRVTPAASSVFSATIFRRNQYSKNFARLSLCLTQHKLGFTKRKYYEENVTSVKVDVDCQPFGSHSDNVDGTKHLSRRCGTRESTLPDELRTLS